MTPKQKAAFDKAVKNITDMSPEEFEKELKEHRNSIFNSLFELPTEENYDQL